MFLARAAAQFPGQDMIGRGMNSSVMGRFETSVIALANVYLQAPSIFLGRDGDGVVLAIRLKVGRPVREQVAAADQIA
jgi:hypothetical protein